MQSQPNGRAKWNRSKTMAEDGHFLELSFCFWNLFLKKIPDKWKATIQRERYRSIKCFSFYFSFIFKFYFVIVCYQKNVTAGLLKRCKCLQFKHDPIGQAGPYILPQHSQTYSKKQSNKATVLEWITRYFLDKDSGSWYLAEQGASDKFCINEIPSTIQRATSSSLSRLSK